MKIGARLTVALLVAVVLLSLAGCGGDGAKAAADAAILGKHTITDDAGRTLEIPTPDKLESVFFTSQLAQVFCYTLNPELLGGLSAQFTDEKLKYLVDGVGDLPYLGSLSGGGEIDREALLAEDIQLIFSISGIGLTEQNISDAEDLQEQSGIPVVLIDGSFDKISDAYRLLGKCVGEEERAEEIAAYLEKVYADVTAAVGDIPEAEKVTYYYAEGPMGLQSESAGSQHSLVYQIAGGHDVYESEAKTGMTDVSYESVLQWDPEIIIAWDDKNMGGADDFIRDSELWEQTKAVQTGRVYTMPYAPFAWVDRPPGVNRFLGLQWLANMFYPDKYDVDMVEVTKDFYSMLYWVEITDEQAKEMLGNSYPPYAGE